MVDTEWNLACLDNSNPHQPAAALLHSHHYHFDMLDAMQYTHLHFLYAHSAAELNLKCILLAGTSPLWINLFTEILSPFNAASSNAVMASPEPFVFVSVHCCHVKH